MISHDDSFSIQRIQLGNVGASSSIHCLLAPLDMAVGKSISQEQYNGYCDFLYNNHLAFLYRTFELSKSTEDSNDFELSSSSISLCTIAISFRAKATCSSEAASRGEITF
ncbi:hypothetical protein CCACVL1_04163 [Corchorus capsularis]|uniref:Uncharacterized protein n=1 Tax=Corchorus capsularis TaxID=210143 RepID=A0A1R3JUY3_COCAP|nr:hypothetical protein CCACVL1_04163 [Corchorus capsularis]